MILLDIEWVVSVFLGKSRKDGEGDGVSNVIE